VSHGKIRLRIVRIHIQDWQHGAGRLSPATKRRLNVQNPFRISVARSPDEINLTKDEIMSLGAIFVFSAILGMVYGKF
jgi:hypothetical protein